MEKIKELEKQRDAVTEKLRSWTRKGIVEISKLHKERHDIEAKLAQLRQERA